MESVLNWSVVISIIGVLVALTNIIVQVVKKAVWDKLPTNILDGADPGDVLRLLPDQGHRGGVVYGCRCGRAGVHGGVCSHVRV